MAYQKKKQKRIFPWVLGFLGIVFVALLVLQMTSEKNTNVAGLPEGSPAPEFTLQSTQGAITLADFKGKNVVLYFYEGNS
jgi:cytochrome oxidase Cu insertion factor (SCO1/SenC/PrrC family)